MIAPSLALLLAAQQVPPSAVVPPAAPAPAPASDGTIALRVEVDSKAGPWVAAINPAMPYGTGDAAPPARITGFPNDIDGKIVIVPIGGATQVNGQVVPSTGVAGDDANDRKAGGAFFPSRYVPQLLYPIHRHALIGVFADAEGKVMGRPFPIGSGVRVPIPDKAAALQLGFNDAGSAANTGTLQVLVRMPAP